MATIPRAPVLALAAGVAALTAACTFSIDSATTVTESFNVAEFDEIELRHPFEATIVVGEDTAVEVEINEELVDRLTIDVDNDRLTIGFDGGLIRTSGPMIVRISTPILQALDVDGAADVAIEGLTAESFDLRVDGASDVTAVGDVERLTLDANGASAVDLDRLTVGRATVSLDGASDARFGPIEAIDGSVRGASSVDVPDSATVDVETSGASSID